MSGFYIYSKVLPLLLMLIAAVYALYCFQFLDKALIFVLTICVFNFFTDLAGNILASKGIKNLWLYNISDVVRYCFWLLYFSASFKLSIQKKLTFALVPFYLMSYVIICFYQPIILYQTLSFIIGGILILCCCFLFLFNEVTSNSVQPLIKNPHFWIAIGLLLYYALNLPFIGLNNWLYINAFNFAKMYFKICVIGSSIILSLTMIKAMQTNLWNKKYGI